MTHQAIVDWLDDGFLHPPTTLTREFTDVDDFLRIPVDGLSEIIQFARVRVDDVMVIVFGPNGGEFRSLLESSFRGRHPEARQVFVSCASTDQAIALGGDLAEVDAIAIAVTQVVWAWDDGVQIQVRGDRHVFLVTVAYQGEKYVASARMSTT